MTEDEKTARRHAWLSVVAWLLEVAGAVLIGGGLFFAAWWLALVWAGLVLVVVAVVVERGNT